MTELLLVLFAAYAVWSTASLFAADRSVRDWRRYYSMMLRAQTTLCGVVAKQQLKIKMLEGELSGSPEVEQAQ